MSEQEELEKQLSDAFHLMYDGLPEPAQLCYRTHRIVAVNPSGAAYGRVPGENCAKGCAGLKAGLCRHAQMLKNEKTTWLQMPKGEGGPMMTTFWIPVTGHPEYYIHFGIGVTIDYSVRKNEEVA